MWQTDKSSLKQIILNIFIIHFDFGENRDIVLAMDIDNKIKDALLAAISEYGGQNAFSRKCGIHQSIISQYVSGKIKRLRYKSWTQLQPYIIKHLPVGFTCEFDHGVDQDGRFRKTVITHKRADTGKLEELFGGELPTRNKIAKIVSQKIRECPREKTLKLLWLASDFDRILDALPLPPDHINQLRERRDESKLPEL